MPKKEGFRILDAQNAAITQNKTKNASGKHPQNVNRKKFALADISNQPQSRTIQDKSQSIESTTKEYINHLHKENLALVKMLEQGNKIIDHNGAELDRLRVNLLKMQEQNHQLALSNNQMLLDLNSDKDRLKMLQHELGWKTGLLKARNLNLKLIKSQEEMESSKEAIDDEKPHETTRNLQPNVQCPSEHLESKDKTENKRLYWPRQSARFNADDLLETNKSRACASQDTVSEQGSSSESTSLEHECSTDGSGPGYESQQFGRPSRAAAKKVQSYKEIPINVKLRRPE